MIHCSCLVQEGQSADRGKDAIQSAVTDFIDQAFGQPADIKWTTVAPGNGFTAGKPSTSSIVSIASPEPLSHQRRESLLREFSSLWTSRTGDSTDEIVAVISDPQSN